LVVETAVKNGRLQELIMAVDTEMKIVAGVLLADLGEAKSREVSVEFTDGVDEAGRESGFTQILDDVYIETENGKFSYGYAGIDVMFDAVEFHFKDFDDKFVHVCDPDFGEDQIIIGCEAGERTSSGFDSTERLFRRASGDDVSVAIGNAKAYLLKKFGYGGDVSVFAVCQYKK